VHVRWVLSGKYCSTGSVLGFIRLPRLPVRNCIKAQNEKKTLARTSTGVTARGAEARHSPAAMVPGSTFRPRLVATSSATNPPLPFKPRFNVNLGWLNAAQQREFIADHRCFRCGKCSHERGGHPLVSDA
jgi:hypothetical protein